MAKPRSQIRPMLAAKADLSKIRYPVIVSPKLDGIRCLISNGVGYSRSWKPIPNRNFQDWVKRNALLLGGLDGELIVGDYTEKHVFRQTSSIFMSHYKPLEHWTYYVFDDFKIYGDYWIRRNRVVDVKGVNVIPLRSFTVHNEEELMEWYESFLEDGVEGIIIRHPNTPYKYGRSTVNQGYLLKLKPEEDDEAIIIGYTEKMHNANQANTSTLGYTERATCKENLIPTGTLGALIVRNSAGQEFNIGTGFTEHDREFLWNNRHGLVGRMLTYKYQKEGAYKVPRFPVFKGWRKDLEFNIDEELAKIS